MHLGKNNKEHFAMRNSDVVSLVQILCRFTGKTSKKKSNGEEVSNRLGVFFFSFERHGLI